MWQIHALVIQKEGMTTKKAHKLAKDILNKDVSIRETEGSWRFDNIPKSRFKKFRSHEIHKGVVLIMGEEK